MNYMGQFAGVWDLMGKWLSLLIWLWGILCVKAMADGIVRLFYGADCVILSVQHFPWGFLTGAVPLILYLNDPPYLPSLTPTLRICAKLLIYMWYGLFIAVMGAGVWLR